MTLAEYVKALMGEASINATAAKAGVSNGALHNILKGVTEKPTPDMLERLAKHFGKSEIDKQSIYARLMEMAGHLDLMPPNLRPSLMTSEGVKQARSGTDDFAQQHRLDDIAQGKEQNNYH